MCTPKGLMRFLTMLAPLWPEPPLSLIAVLGIVLSLPAAARAQYTFGDWAADEGYSPGASMPERVLASSASITSLAGIVDYDWNATPARRLFLSNNQISRIESGDFSGLTNLKELWLTDNQVSSIESGGFSGLTNLQGLYLLRNQISSIEAGDFSGLTNLLWLRLRNNQISSIESGDFSGLTNLSWLDLEANQISSIESGDFSGLTNLNLLGLDDN